MSVPYYKIPIEVELRERIQLLSEEANKSAQNFVHMQLLKAHRSGGLLSILTDEWENPIVYAPPMSPKRFTIRIQDPGLAEALKEASLRLKRNNAQILYSLIRIILNEAQAENVASESNLSSQQIA